MKGMAAQIARFASGAGGPGVLGIGLLVFTLAFYFSTLRPEQLRLEKMQREIAAMKQNAAQGGSAKTAPEGLSEFYGQIPASRSLPDQLEHIYAAADAQNLKLEQGEYRVVKDNLGRLLRFQIILPVKGNYQQIRKFISAALADVPTLSLDSVQFERQKIGDATIDAKIKLAVYLGQAS
jgi:Tfp pilus assembly protein PilO